jgi:YVTN family beta-propeller protein
LWQFCYNLALVYGLLPTAVRAAVALGLIATGLTPLAKVPVGPQSGMVLSAAGSIWTTDLVRAQVVRISPETNAVVRRIPFSTRPFGIAYGAGSIWVADRTADTMARIDPRTNRVVRRIRIGFSSYGVAFGAGSVWVTSEADGTVRRISPRTDAVVKTIRVGNDPNGAVYAFGALWVANLGGGTLVRVDVRTNRLTKKVAIARADWITPSPGALWVSSESGRVVRVDPSTGRVVARIRVGANPLGSAWIGGELWVPNIDDGTVSIIDPAGNAVRTTLHAGSGSGPLSIATAAGDAWVAVSGLGEVWRVAARQ